jgi:hypothetical protein
MNTSNLDLFLTAAGIGLLLAAFAVFSIWSRRFGTEAVEKWAAANGFHLVSVRRRAFVPHWRLLPGKRFQFFRVSVRDRDGASRRAWMKLESDCTEPEIIDVIWDDKKPSA